MDCKSKDYKGEIVVCIAKVQKIIAACVKWTKKSSLGSRYITKAQNYFLLKPRKTLIPIKTRWAYLIIALQCLIGNCEEIDYMCGPMANVGANIKKLLIKWADWEVYIMVVCTMKDIVDSIKIKQATVQKRMLSQAVEELL